MTLTKQQLIIVGTITVVTLAAIGGGVLYTQRNKNTTTEAPQTAQKRKVSAPLNQIPVSERPYVQILPEADGRNIVLQVENVAKPAQSVDYELEYQAGSLLQGAFGMIDLAKVPTTTKILLGSCSAGGACTYHTDVKGGSLVLKFAGAESYALKQDWRYFDNWGNKETAFGSKDAKFQLVSKDLAKQRYVIIYNTPGLPVGLTGTAVSDPYSLTSSSPLAGKAEVTMRANEEGTLTIYGYDGKAWKAFDTKTDGKTATATVDLVEAYVVVKG